MGSIRHSRQIDGLRALAIAPVVLYHAGVPGFGGGFVGVDVFFVISGFLITTLITEQLDAGNFSIWRFYERRARRILPALLVVLAASAGAAWALFIPDDFRNFAQALAATAGFASNVLFASKADYFSSGEGFQPLLHGWSLSVEEQFYLVFPALLIGVAKARRGALLPVVAGLLASSLALATLAAPTHPQLAFYMLPTRFWELLAGAVFALLPAPARSDQRPAQLLGISGLALLGAGFALIDIQTPAPGPMFLLPVAGAALVLRWAGEGTWAGRVLGWRPFVGLGLISYGTYLWHQPILAFVRYVWFGPVPPRLTAAAIGASVLLGALSWRWIEQPIRQRRVLGAAWPFLIAAGAGLALALVAGVAGHLRLLIARSEALAQRIGAADTLPRGTNTILPESGPLPFVLFGDSHARQYFTAFRERFGAGGLISRSGCLSLPGISNWDGPSADAAGCRPFYEQFVALARSGRVRTVFWAQRWDRTLWDDTGTRNLGDVSKQGGPALVAGMDRLMAQLPADVRVVILGTSPTAWAAGPVMGGGYMRCLAYVNVACPTGFPASMAEGRAANQLLRQYAATRARVDYVEAAAPLCSGDTCPILTGEGLYYWDGSHMTLLAARKVAGELGATLR